MQTQADRFDSFESAENLLLMMTQELKNPLTVIQLMTEMTLDELALSSLDGPLGNYVRHLQRASEQLIWLVTAVQGLKGASTSDRFPIGKMEETSIQSLLEGACERFFYQQKWLRPKIENRTQNQMIYCSPQGIRVALRNLVSSAIRVSPENGKIIISAEKSEDRITFCVRYEGPVRSGSGLGTFIARTVIEAHGGKIWAKNEEGWGASLFFDLPMS